MFPGAKIIESFGNLVCNYELAVTSSVSWSADFLVGIQVVTSVSRAGTRTLVGLQTLIYCVVLAVRTSKDRM